MAMQVCPNCDKLIDIDGFITLPAEALFYCECDKIYDMGERFGELIEVPKDEVDLSNLKVYPIQSPVKGVSGGVYIRKNRWKQK